MTNVCEIIYRLFSVCVCVCLRGIDDILDELDGAEVVCAASAGRRERHSGRHGVAVQQDAEGTERPQLEGG